MKNYGCAKGNLSGKNNLRGQLLRFFLHRHLGTGGSRNRIRHKLKFKKPPWFERTTVKNTQNFESTRSAGGGEHQPCPKLILGLLTQTLQLYGKRAFGATAQHRTMKKHFFQTQETSLHNTGCSTLFGKSLESTSGEGGAAAGLVPRAKMHQAQTMECVTGSLATGLKPWAIRLEVSGMGQIMQTASCSWRHIVSWRNEDTGTVWVTWLGLGHEAIVKMGRKQLQIQELQKRPWSGI